jgi:hypothetical protein
VLVNSHNIFEDVPFASSGSPIKLTRSLLECMSILCTTAHYADRCTAPADADLSRSAAGPSTSTSGHSDTPPSTPKKGTAPAHPLPTSSLTPYLGLTLADLPDPQARFAAVRMFAGGVPVVIPPVRDSVGKTVDPRQYPTALPEGTLVDVTTTLRM